MAIFSYLENYHLEIKFLDKHMIFKIGLSISREIDASLLVNYSDELEDFFKCKNYGLDIKEIFISLICLNNLMEHIFKLKKPKYVKRKKMKGVDGYEYFLENTLMIDCKINFKEYLASNDKKRKFLIASSLFNSLSEVFNNKKFKNFDSENFLNDFKIIMRNGW